MLEAQPNPGYLITENSAVVPFLTETTLSVKARFQNVSYNPHPTHLVPLDKQSKVRVIRSSVFMIAEIEAGLKDEDLMDLGTAIGANVPIMACRLRGNTTSVVNQRLESNFIGPDRVSNILAARGIETQTFNFRSEATRPITTFIEASDKNQQPKPPIIAGDLEINLTDRIVMRGGQPVELTLLEYRLLACLAQHQGQLMPSQQILRDLWDAEPADGHVLRVQMSRLRRTLCKHGSREDLDKTLKTFFGIGYMLKK